MAKKKHTSRKTILSIILGTLVVMTCLGLSYWQFSRASEKQKQQQIFSGNEITLKEFIDSFEQNVKTVNGRVINLSGRLDASNTWFLDNQIVDGQVGVDILTLFKIDDLPHSILVNLGFISVPNRTLPEVVLPSSPVTLQFLIKSENLKGFSLSSVAQDPRSARLQFIDTDFLETSAGKKIYPAVLYQQTVHGQADFAQPHYKAVVMSPEKHQAYALQWFLIATAAAIIFYKISKQEEKYEI